MTRPARKPPVSHTPDWLNAPCDDPAAEVARQLANTLRDAIGDRSLRTIEELTGVNYAATSRILRGETWADLRTIARLEHGLGVALYPAFTADED